MKRSALLDENEHEITGLGMRWTVARAKRVCIKECSCPTKRWRGQWVLGLWQRQQHSIESSLGVLQKQVGCAHHCLLQAMGSAISFAAPGASGARLAGRAHHVHQRAQLCRHGRAGGAFSALKVILLVLVSLAWPLEFRT